MSDMAFTTWHRRGARGLRPTAGPRAALRLVLRRPWRTAGVLLAALVGLIAADVLTAADAPPAPPAASTVLRPLTSPWLEVIKPIEIVGLEAGEFANAARSYRARRNLEGGGRQDVIALGTPGAGPALRLSLYRRGSEASVAAPLFADLARQAADAGLAVTRSGLPDLLPTRFGAFEVADVALAAGAGRALPCTGFRLVLDAPALTVAGLSCGGPAAKSRNALGCLLERLDLASGGSDRALADFFAASELRRSGTCLGARLAPDQAHAAWLDDRSATPRRNSRRH